MLQAEAGMREEAGATAADAVVGGPARPRLLLALPAEDVAVPAALQVVPELRVVARRARVARRGRRKNQTALPSPAPPGKSRACGSDPGRWG